MARAERTEIPTALSQKRILFTWLPLAASWLLMALEGPYINAVLARLPDFVRMIAASGLAVSLSITIESPVISLLATTTALARSRQNYLMLKRFTQHLILATTLLQFLLAWTPLFDLVVAGWMGVPDSLLSSVQLGLRLMLFWSAAIAWRRFKQGVMIRFGYSRYVGQGTVVRLIGSAGVTTALALFTDLPGVAMCALGLSAGVIAEALYAQVAAAPIVAKHFGSKEAEKQGPQLGYKELVAFHWPLAASNLLFLFIQPLIAAALARSPEPEAALAAWPVLGGLLFITRAPEMALPEVAITLNEEPESQKAMRRFGLVVGSALSGLLGLIAFTGLSDLYFRGLIGVDAKLAAIAESGAGLAILMPLAMALVTTSRGLLTARRRTRPQAVAMLLELGVLSAVLTAGVMLHQPGVPVAALGMTAAIAVEAGYLGAVARRKQNKTIEPLPAGVAASDFTLE